MCEGPGAAIARMTVMRHRLIAKTETIENPNPVLVRLTRETEVAATTMAVTNTRMILHHDANLTENGNGNGNGNANGKENENANVIVNRIVDRIVDRTADHRREDMIDVKITVEIGIETMVHRRTVTVTNRITIKVRLEIGETNHVGRKLTDG